MRKKFKVMFLLLAVLLVIFLAAGILVGIFAPKMVERGIEQNLKVKASVGKISLSLPLTLTIQRLEIGKFASIKKLSFSPNLVSLLFGKVVIHGLSVVEPLVNLERSEDGKLNIPLPAEAGKGKPPEVYLTSLKVVNAKIIFTDRKVSASGYQLVVDKLNVSVSKVLLPVTSLSANFSVSARLSNASLNPFGSIIFSGWLNLPAKDMDAKLEVKDTDITSFAPYYGNFISNKKLLSAKLNLLSTFKAKNNDLRINTDFDLSGLVYAPSDEELALPDLMKNTLDLFTDKDGNLRLQFEIDTRLDNPALTSDKLKSIILKAAMKNLSSQSPEQLVDKVTGIIDKYKGFGKELKEIFGK